jgi:hypothetical protein
LTSLCRRYAWCILWDCTLNIERCSRLLVPLKLQGRLHVCVGKGLSRLSPPITSESFRLPPLCFPDYALYCCLRVSAFSFCSRGMYFVSKSGFRGNCFYFTSDTGHFPGRYLGLDRKTVLRISLFNDDPRTSRELATLLILPSMQDPGQCYSVVIFN